MSIFIDIFGGALADLPKGKRTQANALRVLSKRPRVSTFDMAEFSWMRALVHDLMRSGLIAEDKCELYPWHNYKLTDKGRQELAQLARDHPVEPKP